MEFDIPKYTADISIFQITTSSTHRGSAKGYTIIRKIMARVRKILKDETPIVVTRKAGKAKVNVTYFLIRPEDGSHHEEWRVPAGWNNSTRTDDHRGKVFCVRAPVHHSKSRLFTPDFCNRAKCRLDIGSTH